MFTDTYTEVTEGIRVTVRSAYLSEESSPAHDYYTFVYRVHIQNESSYRVQLLRRKWIITDGVGRKSEVSGEGVVGKQPVLDPGESHEYESGTHFSTPVGKMHGFYYFIRLVDGGELKVRIPDFTMIVPQYLN